MMTGKPKVRNIFLDNCRVKDEMLANLLTATLQ